MEALLLRSEFLRKRSLVCDTPVAVHVHSHSLKLHCAGGIDVKVLCLWKMQLDEHSISCCPCVDENCSWTSATPVTVLVHSQVLGSVPQLQI